MTTLEPAAPSRSDAKRSIFASLALGGVLYWLGFRRRERCAPPRRAALPAMSAAAQPVEPHLAPVAARPQSWRDVLAHVYENIGRHRILAIAAGVTFYALLAIFPAIAAIVTVYGLFADAGSIAGLLDTLTGVVPGGALQVIGDEVTRIASGPPASLSVTLVVSLAISLWSANAGMKAIFDALNVVYNVEDQRGFFKLNAVSLAYTLSAIVFLLAAMASVVVVPIVLNYLSIRSSAAPLVALARWPAMFVVTVFALSLVYRFGPSRDMAQWRWITWGSASAAVVWLAASLLFSWYAANFGNYNATYGSLGAVIGFMTWMWLSTIVVLTGAEIDAVMERWDRGSAH